MEEVQHAAHIDEVFAHRKRYIDAGFKAFLSSFDREITRAKNFMASRRHLIGIQVEHEELCEYLCVCRIEKLKKGGGNS